MDGWVKRMYLHEEDFLEEWYATVEAVLQHLPHAWQPNFQCDDRARAERDQLLARGQLATLTFDSAVIFYDKDVFSSIQLYLRSSARLVIVRVRWAGAEMM